MVNVRKPTVIGVNVEHIDTSSMIFSSIFLGGNVLWYEWSTLYPLVLIIIYCMTRLLLLVLLCCYRKEMEKHLHIYCLT